jgi:hypothetical protein
MTPAPTCRVRPTTRADATTVTVKFHQRRGIAPLLPLTSNRGRVPRRPKDRIALGRASSAPRLPAQPHLHPISSEGGETNRSARDGTQGQPAPQSRGCRTAEAKVGSDLGVTRSGFYTAPGKLNRLAVRERSPPQPGRSEIPLRSTGAGTFRAASLHPVVTARDPAGARGICVRRFAFRGDGCGKGRRLCGAPSCIGGFES